jgi:hypothetical protein
VKGKHVLISFQTSAYRAGCPQNGRSVIEAYDDLVYSEQEFQGMVKYGTLNSTRIVMLADTMNPGVAAYATDYRTVYGHNSQTSMLRLSDLKSPTASGGAISWMPAHEIGHVNQTRPGLKWLGMTEVTNNILSQYITTKWNVKSRLQYDTDNGKNRYQQAIEGIVNAGIAHNQHGDVFCKLVPFWQLKLFMHNAKNNPEFFKDLYQKIRENPNPTAQDGSSMDGMCQLEFVRLVCEVSGLDFTDFFEKWGFLKAVSFVLDDYSTNTFTVTQTSIDKIKAQIVAMQLPPVPADLYKITDINWTNYR